MNQSSEPKKFPPTAKKLKDLAKKGQFPKTELAEPTIEVVAFTIFFVGLLYIIFDYVNVWFEVISEGDILVGFELVKSMLGACVAILLLLKVALTSVQWVFLNKTNINTESLGFKIEKLNPVQGVKNIFGPEALSKSFRKVLELIFLLFLLKYIFDISGEQISVLKELNNSSYFAYLLLFCIVLVGIFYFVFGLCVGSVDYLVEKYHFNKKNRMTFTEIKNEMKETEGSPEIKSERKRKMREVMNSPVTKGRKPTFALANPTHILVPICYDPNIDKAPIIMKISTDLLALEEKEKLKKLNIPIIEHKKLARALYRKTKKGEVHLPKEFYRDVALIISSLKRKKNDK